MFSDQTTTNTPPVVLRPNIQLLHLLKTRVIPEAETIIMLCLRRSSQLEEEDEEEDIGSVASVRSVVSFSSPTKVKAGTAGLSNLSNFSRVLSFSSPQTSDR